MQRIPAEIGRSKLDMDNCRFDLVFTTLELLRHQAHRKVLKALTVGLDISMIGKFGVGFHSSYLVAEKVFAKKYYKMDYCTYIIKYGFNIANIQ